MEPALAPAVLEAVRRHMPHYPIDSVELLGEGLDHAAYEVNGELIVRFSKAPDGPSRAVAIRREAQLLRVVRQLSPLPTPEPRFASEDDGCLAYLKLPGAPLLDVPVEIRLARAVPIGHRLGALLAALHAVPAAVVAGVVDVERLPLAAWRDEAEDGFVALSDRIPVAYHDAIRAVFDAGVPADAEALAFSHNDLGIEHVLVDGSSSNVTGVIDWTDAAIVDPAHDFGRILRDLGPDALDAALRAYPSEPGLQERAVFFARCSVFEDLAHGLGTHDPRYVDKCLRSMTWLFPSYGTE